MTDWDKETPSQCAERAARRAIEAISRVGTMSTDISALADRIEALEASNRDLTTVLETVLGILENS